MSMTRTRFLELIRKEFGSATVVRETRTDEEVMEDFDKMGAEEARRMYLLWEEMEEEQLASTNERTRERSGNY